MNLAKIDTKTIGEMPEPTEEEVSLAMIGADLPPDMEVAKVRDRAVFGRFTASSVAGYLVADAYADAQWLDRAKRVVDGQLQAAKNPEAVASLADAMKNLVNASVANRALQLKSAEALAYGGKKERKRANAPTDIMGGVSVTGENVQVNLGPALPEKAA